MKVALVFDGLGFGGIERVGIHYARLFLKMGYEIDIYNLKPDCTELEKEFPKECRILHKKMPDLILPDPVHAYGKTVELGKISLPLAVCRNLCADVSLPAIRRKAETV